MNERDNEVRSLYHNIRGPSSIAHFVQGGHDLGSIRRVEGRV